MNNKHSSGFTLIELLIAIAIISILVAMAVPGYTKYVKQSRRDDAKHLLMLNAQRLQRCFTLEGVYNGNCLTRQNSKGGYYALSKSSQFTTNTFNLTAVPVIGSSQETDGDCQTFSYDHTGRRTATGNDYDTCW